MDWTGTSHILCVCVYYDSPYRAFSTYHLHGYKDATSAPAYLRQAASQPRVLQQQQPNHHQQQQEQEEGHTQAPPSSRQMAKAAFDFILQHMYDPVSGMFNWLVTQEGHLLQDNKVLYGHWFVLYSLR